MADIEQAVQWFIARQGKVTYSMVYRNGPHSYDCSSAVFYSLKHAGFSIPFIGNTETLFSLEGKLLQPISSSQKQRGDIFVSGVKGGSNNAYGHTGILLSPTQAIHCSSVFNGIGVSSSANSSVWAYGGAPVYWYRVIGSTSTNPDPTEPSPDEMIDIKSVNDGKEFIENTELINIFGRKVKEVHFDNVKDAYDLKEKSIDYMAEQTLDVQSLKLTFLELSLFDIDYSKIKRGDVITVINEELNINRRMIVNKIDKDLFEPELGIIELGRMTDKITDLFINR